MRDCKCKLRTFCLLWFVTMMHCPALLGPDAHHRHSQGHLPGVPAGPVLQQVSGDIQV
jgi:hypothetical protein